MLDFSLTMQKIRRLFSSSESVLQDYYSLLGVSPTSSKSEIQRNYSRLVKQYHPDINPEEQEKFISIRDAYETLSKPESRKAYDELCKFSGGAGGQNVTVHHNVG